MSHKMFTYRLLRREPSTIKLSSINETISEVSDPLSKSSPRDLNVEKESSCVFHSAITCFNFASISRSFTAEMQISWKRGK